MRIASAITVSISLFLSPSVSLCLARSIAHSLSLSLSLPPSVSLSLDGGVRVVSSTVPTCLMVGALQGCLAHKKLPPP